MSLPKYKQETIIGIDKLVIYNISVHIDNYKFANISIQHINLQFNVLTFYDISVNLDQVRNEKSLSLTHLMMKGFRLY